MRAAAIATLATMSVASEIEVLYAKYVAQFNKSYLTDEEYFTRMEFFAKKHFIIEEHNMGNTYTLAHNMFSDWTEEELSSLTGYIPADYPTDLEAVEVPNFTGPASLDWR
jgi:hypothetical protein